MTEEDHCQILMDNKWPKEERYDEIADRHGCMQWEKRKLAPTKVVEKIIRDYSEGEDKEQTFSERISKLGEEMASDKKQIDPNCFCY